MLDALSGIVVTFRHRRFNIRRVLEFAEITKKGEPNVLYRWDVKTDKIIGTGKTTTLANTLSLYSGMSSKEIDQDVDEKVKVLDWMVKKGYYEVDQVGRIVSNYYMDPNEVVAAATKNKDWDFKKV